MPERRKSRVVTAGNVKIGGNNHIPVQSMLNIPAEALKQLNESNIVELDEERKAAMVSNLLVVLCGNHDAQPVVNSGSLY